MKFGNDNPLSPNDLIVGKSYITKDGKVMQFTGETQKDDFKVYYNFSIGGRGNWAMTHDEVLDNVTIIKEQRMRYSTQRKLEEIVRRIVKEEYWNQTSEKSVGDSITISDDMGGGTGTIMKIIPKDGDQIALVKMDDGSTQEFSLEYLNSL